MSPIRHEPQRTGEHLVSEANGSRSRHQGLLATGRLGPATVVSYDDNKNYVALNPTATDSTKTAIGALYSGVDATDTSVPCVVHIRDCEFHGELLIWPDGITEAQKATAISDLEERGVILR